MGYKIGIEIANSPLSLEEQLSWHLEGNHYPPIDKAFIPVAMTAISMANDDNWDAEIDMPNGLTRTVEFIVTNMHLEPFVSSMDVPQED